MFLIKTLLACLILFGVNVGALAAADPAQYRLTSEMLRKLEAADAEAKKMTAATEEEDDEDEEADDDEDANDDDRAGQRDKDDSVEGIARKLDADPKLKALLAKHGISSMDYAMSVHAMLHAGMYLMFEQSMPKPKAAELFNGYTKAQQANIELLRKSALMKN